MGKLAAFYCFVDFDMARVLVSRDQHETKNDYIRHPRGC
jgi:hypothetical protein